MERTEDPSVLDDAALVAMALESRNAYGLLVARFEAPLRRYATRLLGPHAQHCDDVLQEAFIKAYVNLRDYDQTRPFGPWIFRIAHNEAISHLRKRKAEPQPLAGEDGLKILESLSDGRDPQGDDNFHGAEKAVRDSLDTLDQRYRDVLVLRFLEDKSYTDIGDILALPAGTVATLIKRGVERLRASLDAAGHGFGRRNT